MSDNKAQIERFSPGHLHNKPHFTNLVTSEGGKTIHLSGLVASDADGELAAPGDLGGQMDFIFGGIKMALAEVGATPAHVVRQRIFVVDLQLAHRPIIAGAMNASMAMAARPRVHASAFPRCWSRARWSKST